MRSENLTNRKMIKKIEMAMKQDLTREANKLINDFQKKTLIRLA